MRLAGRGGGDEANVLPLPGRLSTLDPTPPAPTMGWQIASPNSSPSPASLLVQNGSKIRPSDSGAIRAPVTHLDD